MNSEMKSTAGSDFTGSTIVPNEPFSMIGCIFIDLGVAVSAINSDTDCFLCRPTFEN
jgi:hypothetical protein